MNSSALELPPEVTAAILSKLDDVSALLNCRLVCRSWNVECLSLLRKSRFRRTIVPSDLENIEKAAQFGNHDGKFILPFRLDQAPDQGISQTEAEFEEQCVLEFQTMGQGIAQLSETCGPDCIQEYRLNLLYGHCGAKGLMALNKFLGLISIHLKKFDLCFVSTESLSRRETVRILREAPVLFPNLKELVCKTSSNDYENNEDGDENVAEEDREWEDIDAVLIENSHNLETLSITGMTGDVDVMPKRISSGSFSYWPTQPPPALRTLTSLHLGHLYSRVKFWESIRASRVEPILETFGFSAALVPLGQEIQDVVAMENTLRFFAKTLKSITVKLGTNADGKSNSVAFPLRFPALPQLEHLGITFIEMHCPGFVDPQSFNFNETTFPVLNSVQIPFGCLLLAPPPPPAPAPLDFSFMPSTIFPTIQNLTLLLTEFTFRDNVSPTYSKLVDWEEEGCGYFGDGSEISPQRYLEHAAQVFPNVTSLTLRTLEVGDDGDIEGIELVMEAIVESELAVSVDTFEVKGYGNNHLLNVVVLRDPDFVNKMTNLKKIRLRGFWDIWGGIDSVMFACDDDLRCLTLLTQHFPTLEEIEISAVWMGGNDAESLEILGLLAARFPGWDIKQIKVLGFGDLVSIRFIHI